MNDLRQLADLLVEWNEIGSRIAALINRPANIGHLGEFIASRVFDIALEQSASFRGCDGHFRSGALEGRSVNIKWYAKLEGLLDVTPGCLPDFYLVLSGPRSPAVSSRGAVRPLVIEHAFLFDANDLLARLQSQGVKVGIATSVRRALWNAAELFPTQKTGLYLLSEEQRVLLGLYGGNRGTRLLQIESE